MSNKKIGIDVSEWQGVIDWEKVKPNIDFAIIRLGYGQNTLDSQAKRNISECNRLGIPYGVYWFSYAYNVERAKNEAHNAIKRLEELGGKLDYPFWFDWEYDSRNHAAKQGYTISNQLLRDMATAFCTIIEEAGYHAGIYANQDYVHNYYGEEIFHRFDLWYAYLDTNCDRDVNIHQFAFDYHVDGIDGNVDANWCFTNYPSIIAGKPNTAGDEAFALPTLRNGSEGETVKAMQILLIGNQCSCGSHGADGIFGTATENAVMMYQDRHDLAVDGICGPKTWASLLGC